MEPRELISAIEANAKQHDSLVLKLVGSLAEHKAATADIARITMLQMRLREERTSMIVEAAFTAKDIDEAATRRKLYQLLGMPS